MYRKSLAALVGLTLALGAGAGFSQPPATIQMNAPRRAKRGLFSSIPMPTSYRWSYGGPGITMAQQQRASRKKRNQARHKRHVRA